MIRSTYILSALALGVSAVALTGPASAQVDTIIVSAQKKDENIQDVPIAIAAFGAEELAARRIQGLDDIAEFAPGIYTTPNPADPTGVRINIRGVGTFDPQIGQDSRIAIYQDGVYLGRTQGLAFDMPDLVRIEVLKGPQGTLYGRNAVGGAINLISAAPNGEEFSGTFTGEYGNFNNKRFNAAFNIPLADNLGLRLSGLWSDRDGWVENDGPGTNFGGEEKYGFRVALGWDANDWARFDLAYDYNRVRNEPLFYQSLPEPSGQPFSAAIGTSTGRQEEVTTSFFPEEGDNVTSGVSLVGTFNVRESDQLKVTLAYRELDSSRFVTLVPTADPDILNAIAAGFNQALGPLPIAFNTAGQGANIRADWADQFGPNALPNTGLFLSPPGGAPIIDGQEQFSVEATYTGSVLDDRIEFTAGAFYYDETTGTGDAQASLTDINSYLFVLAAFNPGLSLPLPGDMMPTLGPIPRSLTFLQQAFLGPNPAQGQANLESVIGFPNNPSPIAGLTVFEQLANARQSAGNQLTIDTQAFAFYGEVTFNVTDALSVTGGFRYSDESKDGVGQAVSPFFLDTIDLTGAVIEPNIGAIDFDVFNPSAVIEWRPIEEVLLYASYKESFRSGGFNAAAVGNRIPGETFSADFLFGREDITSYEGGFKADLFDNKLRFNASGFYYDFSDQQTTVALDPVIATSRAVVNTDETLYGFEVDLIASLTEALSFRGSYTFIDGDAGDVTNPLTNEIEVRDELQGTPQNSFLVGLDYETPISNTMNFFASTTFSYKDDILAIPQNALRLTDQNLWSARIGVDYEMPNGKNARLAVWAENLLDDEYTIDSLPFETFGNRTVVFGQPRSYGLTVTFDF
ncbi:MAG: TonB-dependent receptor [Pseudomonadota bacterium]